MHLLRDVINASFTQLRYIARPSPPTPLPEGEGSVERNRAVARFRNVH